MRCAGVTRTALSLAVAGAFAGMASQAHASAFALIEQSASGLGTSFAGAAASAEDATTIFYNPAGMSLLPDGKQISAGAAFIDLSIKFSDSGSVASGTGIPGVATAQRPLGGNGGEAGSLSTVPNVYFAMDLMKDMKLGLGISSPFGLKTEYDSDWVGRFQAIKSQITTYNVNPAISYKVNDTVSLGAGLNYQHIDAELTNAVNFVAATFGGVLAATGNLATAQFVANSIPAANAEGTVDVKGSDAAWGYNLGAMFQLAPTTRLGVSYRSSIKYNVGGTVNFSNVPAGLPAAVAAQLSNGNVNLDIKMPDSASFALQHQLDPKWILLADATWTGWSKIQQLQVVRDNGTTLSTTPENFKDTWRFGVGTIYRYTDAWSLKAGLAYDETPVNDTDRTARLPDQNRTWLSVGGQYRLSKDGTLDLGYAHLFVKDTSINQNGGNATLNGQLTGTYTSSIDIFGVQFAYRF